MPAPSRARPQPAPIQCSLDEVPLHWRQAERERCPLVAWDPRNGWQYRFYPPSRVPVIYNYDEMIVPGNGRPHRLAPWPANSVQDQLAVRAAAQRPRS